jgi:hypothetical protein
MNRRLLYVGAILLAVALVAMAADAIGGKWTYEQPSRGGGGGGGGTPRIITLDLKVDGATLTGTILQPMGGRGGGGGGTPPAPTPTQITNGKVSGSTISFDVTRETQNGSMTTKYEGTVSGSELKLKITRTGQDGSPQTSEVVAKKAS